MSCFAKVGKFFLNPQSSTKKSICLKEQTDRQRRNGKEISWLKVERECVKQKNATKVNVCTTNERTNDKVKQQNKSKQKSKSKQWNKSKTKKLLILLRIERVVTSETKYLILQFFAGNCKLESHIIPTKSQKNKCFFGRTRSFKKLKLGQHQYHHRTPSTFKKRIQQKPKQSLF